MGVDERIDDLLDELEDVLEANPQADVDAFVRSQGVDLDDESLAVLRKKAIALAAMNNRLVALQDTNSIQADTASGSSERLALSQLQAGFEPIPGYKLVERLGAGGFGEVWKAIAPGEFPVALKFVRLDGKAGEIERRSLDVMRDVRHAHLLSVFGTWQQGDLLIIATELADRTLLERHEEAVTAGEQGIPRQELLEYMAEAAKGIDFLNEPGTSGRPKIQHRDIKPQNLLLSGGSVKVGDFGLARSFQFDATGHTGSLTLAYAAPEFLDGKTSSRSDQYSLAVTYCFLRSGRLPFEGTEVQIIDGHRKQQPDLSMLPEVERPIVARALSKKPKDRWSSCGDFVRHLGAPDDEKKPSEGPSRSGSQASKISRSTRSWVWAVAGTLPLLLVACWLSGLFSTPEKQPKVPGLEQEQSKGTTDNAVNERDRTRIAVLYFENQSDGEKDLDALAKGLCSMMITRLDDTHKYDLVERERLQEVLDELKLTRSAMFDQKNVASIGKLVGARFLVLGSYFEILNVFRIDARLVDVETGVTVTAAGVEGKSDEFSVLLSQLVDQLVQKHQGVDAPESQEDDVGKPKDESVSRVSLSLASDLGEAVNAYDQGEVDTALAKLDALIEAIPEFDEARKLRKRWREPRRESNSDPEKEATRASK